MSEYLRFIHITDTHIGPTPEYTLDDHNTLQKYQALVRHLNEDLPFKPEFIFHTGDIAYDPDPAAYEIIQEEAKKLNHQCYYVRGNHDDPDQMRRVLPNLPDGEGRINYEFIHRDFHFIVLDTMGHVQPSGYLEDEQLAWLHSTCEKSPARSLVIIMHHNAVKTGIEWIDRMMILKNHDAFFDTVRSFQSRIRCVLFGHIHRASTSIREGIMCASAVSTTSALHSWPDATHFAPDAMTPGGYNIVTLTHMQTFITSHNFPFPRP